VAGANGGATPQEGAETKDADEAGAWGTPVDVRCCSPKELQDLLVTRDGRRRRDLGALGG
jgi:hypothetical protein